MSDIRVGIKLTTDGAGKVTAEITQVKKGLEGAGAAGEAAGKKNVKAAADTGAAYKGLAGQIDTVKKAFLAYVSVQAAWNGAKQAVAAADAWTNLNSKLRVVTGTHQELATALADVSAIANRYQADIDSVGAAYNRLAPIAANMGKSQGDLKASLEAVSAALKLSGASTSEASETLRQFGQALSGPTVQMEEMNTIIDSASVLWQGLQRQFPQLIQQYGSLKEAVGKGALSNRDLLEATIRLREEFDKQASTMSTTVSGAWQVFKNELEKAIGQVDQGSGSTNKLANNILELSKTVPLVIPPLITLANTVLTVINKLGAAFSWLSDKFQQMQNWMAQAREAMGFASGTQLFDANTGRPANPNSQYTTGGGFGADEITSAGNAAQQAAPKFDGINRQLGMMGDAANGAAGGMDKLKKGMGDGLEQLTRKWKLNSDQVQTLLLVYKEAQRIGVNPAFAVSLSKFESGLDMNKTSGAGAVGAMQVMPATFAGLKHRYADIEGSIKDTVSNIRAGLHYIKELQGMFGRYDLAAAGYLAGPGAVQKAGGMPHKVDRYTGITTEQYANGIIKNAQQMSQILGNTDLSSWEKETDSAFTNALNKLNSQFEVADSKRKEQLEKVKQELEQANQMADAAEKQATVSIKMAVDPASRDKAMADLNDAQKKRDEVIRKSINISTGVTDAKSNLDQIEKEIALAKQMGVYEEKRDELTSKREKAANELHAAEIAAQTESMKMEKERQDSEAKFDADKRAAYKDFASLNVEQQVQLREGMLAELALKTKSAEYSQAVMAQYMADQKASIDAGVDQAKNQVAASEAERAQLLQSKQGVSALLQERENITANLKDELSLLDQEKQAALDKLNIDAQQLEYSKQIADWQLQQMEAINPNDQDAILAARQKVLEIEGQITENAQKQLDIINQQPAAQAKLVTEANKNLSTNSTNFVQEQQLELNAFWDQYMGRLNDYASLWQEITGETQNGFSKMTIAMGEYAKQAAQIAQFYQKNPDAFGDMTGAMEGIQQAEAALAGMAKTLIALRSNYAEGSKGYQQMTDAAQRMMEVQRALQVVEGVLAVIHQLSSGEPYSAIPRALGVAAMIASLGVSTGASGGMTNRQAGNATQTGGSTSAGGGVFGDASAKSNSIANSLEIVAKNSNANLSYSAGMLRSLKNIELAMAGTTNAIIRGVKPADVQGLGYKGLGVAIDPLGIGKLIGSGVYTKITNFGIKALPQQLDQIIANGFQGMNWTEVTKSTKILGITISKKTKDYFSELDSGVTGQITRVIRSMADSVKEAGKAFGISGDQFNKAMANFTVNFGQISTKGLKGKDLQEAIQQVFSSMSDDMAQAFQSKFNLNLGPFQRAGEGMYETLIRVADGINVATGLLAQAGLQAINYQNIVLKQGDVAAEIVRQSIVAFEGIGSVIGGYIDQAVGSAEELLSVYQDLLTIRATSAVVGLAFKNLNNDMVVAAGGVAALKDAMTYYLENFLGVGEQSVAAMNEFSSAIHNLGIQKVPKTTEQFKALLKSFDQTTDAGRLLYVQVLKLAPAFIKARDSAKALDDLYAKLTNTTPFADLDAQWKQLWDDWSTVIAGKTGAIDSAAQSKIDAQQQAINGWKTAISSAQSAIGMLTSELVKLSINKAPASVIAGVEKAIESLVANMSDWAKGIQAANKAIIDIRNQAEVDKSKVNLQLVIQQGYSLINNLWQMWEKLISSIRSMQSSLQDQLDDLAANPLQAKANTANTRLSDAQNNYNKWKALGINDPSTELGYLQAIQTAVMNRYQAEMALIQEAIDTQTAALNAELDAFITARNAQLDAEIAAINAATDAAVAAAQAAIDAAVKAQQKADEAILKAMQKRFDAENKLLQKQFDAILKARQKEYDAANKLTQRQFDAEKKALQKKQDASMKVLTDELDAANTLKDAIKSIAEYAQSMKLGANTPLSPEGKLREAQKQYQDLLAKARSGDADAMAKLSGASDAYLEAARNYYGSSTNYEDIFKGVQQAMESIGGMSAPDPNSIQSRIDALKDAQELEMQALQDKQDAIMDTIREAQQDAIDALRETQQDQLDAIREAQQSQIDSVREAQQAQIDAMREAGQKQIDAIKAAAQAQIDAAKARADADIAARRAQTEQAIKDLSDPTKNEAIKTLRDATVLQLQNLQTAVGLLETAAQAQASQWRQDISNWLKNNHDLMDDADYNGLVTVLNAVGKAINKDYIPPFAKGGQAMPGYALVGEQGPEIVRFNSPGQVYTAADTQRMIKSGSDEETKAILREIKTEAKASVTVQSSAFQKMIDKLNSLDDRINSMERNQRLDTSKHSPRFTKA